VAVVGIYYRVGGGVVSLRRVQGWEDTRILSSFSDGHAGAGASWFGAALAGFFLLLCALSLYI
jgi:hypothetical protein